VPDVTELDRDLKVLETEMRRLEAEYNMYFAGRLPRPPVETRTRVTALVRRLDRAHISNYAERFRFATLQARFHKFIDLWERGMRSREEGRPGPFRRAAPAPPPPAAPASRESVAVPPDPGAARDAAHVAAFRDPTKEADKLQALYERVSEARRLAGEEVVPFQKFASLVTSQVSKLRQKGCDEVSFRVAVKDGKVNFTARGVKDGGGDD
jgi:hypothetical protein